MVCITWNTKPNEHTGLIFKHLLLSWCLLQVFMFGTVQTFLLPLPPDVLQVANQDLVVDGSSEVSRLEEVHAVQVRDVHSSLIGRRAVRAVLLNVHAEKTHIRSVDVLERKEGFHPVREGLGHLSAVNKPGERKKP